MAAVWMALTLIALGLLALLTIAVTEGKYFGKALMRWIYDRWGPTFFGRVTEREVKRWRDLVQSLKLRGDESILDVGMALGELPLTIAAWPGFRGRVVGLDWSPQMIEKACQRAAQSGLSQVATFRVADARKPLPFGAGEFDTVVCIGLLEGLPQPTKLLNELVRVLHPEGRLILSCYHGLAGRLGRLSEESYRAHLEPLGFGDFQRRPFGRHHDLLIVGPLECRPKAQPGAQEVYED